MCSASNPADMFPLLPADFTRQSIGIHENLSERGLLIITLLYSFVVIYVKFVSASYYRL